MLMKGLEMDYCADHKGKMSGYQKNGFSIFFVEALRELYKITHSGTRQEYKAVWRQIAAQWCLESNYGESTLAKHANNFSGLKWRHELDPSGLMKCDYKDWSSESDIYFKCNIPTEFPELYFRFINRSIYSNVDPEFPYRFIYDLAESGFVGSLPGFVPNEKAIKHSIAEEYERRINDILMSPKFSDLMTEVLRFDELPASFLLPGDRSHTNDAAKALNSAAKVGFKVDDFEKIMMPDFGSNPGGERAEMPKEEVKMSSWTEFRDEMVGALKLTAKETAVNHLFQVFFRDKSGKVVKKSVDAEIKEQLEAQKEEIRYYRALADEYKRCLGLSIDMNLENNLMPDFVLNEPLKPDWL